MADTSLFFLQDAGTVFFVLFYVDDIVIKGNCTIHVQHFIDLLGAQFSLKDLDPLSYFLSIEVSRTTSGLTLTEKYINDLLCRVNVLDAKLVSTPMTNKPPLTKLCGTSLKDPNHMVIGSLQYVLFARPDIALVVNKLSQYMQNPSK